MVENWVGIIQLPLGLGLNFLINGTEYIIPMAIEEPSVIAAASSAAKFISERGGGFKVHTTEPIMPAQIQIIGVNYSKAKYILDENKQNIIQHANTHCKRMYERGGGVKDFRHRKIYEVKGEDECKDVIVVELLIDVQESMGMNISNTVAEATSDYVRKIIGEGKIGLRITSNLCLERMSTAFFKIPIEKLGWKDVKGKDVAKGIMSAYEFGVHDIKRATTHNKGIMNGIDAVAIALGQDWRAIESASHAYATLDGGYRPLTKYRIAKDNAGEEYLMGELELPLSCASKGGVLGTNPSYFATHLLAKRPTGRQVASFLSWVGLAQNFAAIRALAIEGIQKGHMNLHAKNIAISAGVPSHLIKEVVEFMKNKGSIDTATAENYMKAHKIYESTSRKTKGGDVSKKFSTCFVRIEHPKLTEVIILNLIIETPDDQEPIHLSITKDEEDKKVVSKILGDHSYDWILEVILLWDQLPGVTDLPGYDKAKHISLFYRLKLITILINRVITTILKNYKEKGVEIIESVYSVCEGSQLEYKIPGDLFFLHNLLIELIATYKYYIDENVDKRIREVGIYLFISNLAHDPRYYEYS